MADEKDKEQQTEAPTERRIQKAYDEGNAPFSKDMVQLALIVTFTFFVYKILPLLIKNIVGKLSSFFSLKQINFQTIYYVFIVLFLTLLVFFLAPLLASAAQGLKGITIKRLSLKTENLSWARNAKQLVSKNGLFEFGKNLVKLCVLLIAVFSFFKSHAKEFDAWVLLSIQETMGITVRLIVKMFIVLCVFYGILAILDYFWQRYRFIQSIKMTRQEIKEEFKETEGNPEIRQKIRSLQRSRSRQTMMGNVEKATVVITNPTHYAVALAWDPNTMNAPRVTAKGQDFLAEQIKKIAKKANVPIMENPVLARSLYKSVDIEKEILPEHYKAVADIIRIVQKM